MSRYRNFCFTHNNYENTQLEDTIECRYIAYAKEVGESGTPHLQGYVTFHNAKTKSAVIKAMPGCHIEVMLGSYAQNESYCSKAGQLVERGEKPMENDNKGRAEQLRWSRALELAKEGKIEEIDADIQLRHYNTLKSIRKDYMKPPPSLTGRCGVWIHGTTKTGKTRTVRTAYPDCYRKPRSKWWDGYQGQEVVHLDEVSPAMTPWIAPFLKDWGDWSDFHAETKGGAMLIRPKKFIITSNYTIDEMGFNLNDIGPIKDRFKEIEKTADQDIII
nr:MAG: replication associated protein [Cressdnaviricota sp.]